MLRFYSFAYTIIRLFLHIAMAALFVMMMATVVDVFMRYAFNSPVTGTYDVVEICLAITVFYSLGAVISGVNEILIDLIDQMVSSSVLMILKRIAALLSCAVLIFIFVSMITPAMQSHQYGEMRLELNMPNWIVWVIVLIGMSGGVLASIVNLLHPPLNQQK